MSVHNAPHVKVMKDQNRKSPERSTFAVILQEKESEMVNTLIGMAQDFGFSGTSAVIFDEVWLETAPNTVADPSGLADRFFATTGVCVRHESFSEDNVPIGAVTRRVRSAVETGRAKLLPDTMRKEGGRDTCLPFALSQLLPSAGNTDGFSFTGGVTCGPVTCRVIADACPQLTLHLAGIDWTTSPGTYLLRDGRRLRDGIGHVSGLRIAADTTSVFHDQASANPVRLGRDAHSEIWSAKTSD